MALSNTQFIERRVYDDDVDIAPPVEPPKEPPKIIDPNEELEKLKKSLQTFESMHELVQILDSDSSDDEDEERLVLKPKNVYANRPLPYIIGSELWRTKWHAGLVVEDSDTDSAASKHEPEEEYSDSEPEVTDNQTEKHIEKDTWISTSPSAEASASTSLTKPAKPADIAAELARRLGGDMIPPPPPMEAMPEPTTKKVYRPEQPTTATIFSNEPPPLDQVESDSEEDIFAELHRNRYTHNDRTQPVANVVDELFGNVESKQSSTKNTQVLFDDDSESELFAEKPKIKEKVAEESSVKKPVGGISLFGSNKQSISIGAAILKRQQPKSSDEESDNSESPKTSNIAKLKPSDNLTTSSTVVTKDNQEKVSSQNNNKDLLENLFTKPKSKNTYNKTIKQETKEKIPEKKVDLFTDDLFDDIDDIFTSKVTKTPDTRKEKLFDSDDDIFNEKIISKPRVSQAKRSIVFSDSDDDLFKETDTKNLKNNIITVDKELNKNGLDKTPNIIVEKEINTPKSNKNGNNDLFNKKDLTKEVVSKKDTNKEFSSKIQNNVRNKRTSFNSSDIPGESMLDSDNDTKNNKEETKKSSKDKFESILDSESDDDLFKNNTVSNRVKVSGLKTNIFDDDSEDELFGNVLPISNKQMPQTKNNLNINETVENRTNINDSLEKVDSQALIPNATLYTNVPEEVVKATESTSVTLFNDESDDELFGGKSKNPTIEDTKCSTLEDKSLSNSINEMSQHKTLTQDCSHKVGNIEPKDSSSTSSTSEDKKNLQISNANLPDAVNTDFRSPLVFNDDEMDELLTSNSKTSKNIENTPDDKKQQELYLNESENLMECIINTNETNELSKSESEGVCKETLQSSLVSSQSDSDIQRNEYNELGFHEEIIKESKIVYDIEENENTLTEPLDRENDKKTSTFSEIFHDVPPEFEKPKEPKKSKNVNALFDDDSDDETMFFKKSSDVSDELLPSPDYTQERFSLFHDEPPSIEVDFTAYSSSPHNVEEIIKDTGTDLNTETNMKSAQNFNKIESTKVDRNLKKIVQNDFGTNADEIPQSLESSIRSTNAVIADKIITLQTDVKKPIEGEIKEKSIRKLKPVHFNINVNTLLPGAAHKKPKLVEELDGTASSKAENDEFEKQSLEKESAILDNKLSKERARIPVKRRPSTRRARKEAARKSGIDFGDSIDSTDNSSSIDEPNKYNKTDDSNKNVTEVESINKYNSDANTESSKSTTKVVYILNDEDIFSDDNKNVETDSNSQSLKLQTNFKNVETPSTTGKDKNQNGIDKKSIFDLSDSETELFGGKRSNVTIKTKLFDSDTDDDDDLFGSKKETTAKEAKQNLLFSDESDGELFSTSKQGKKLSNTPSEPVFEDPLSMLNQDDS
ncbi:WASH complex subunit 2 isoform X2 [Pieris rapae]|nr:WASH complex subunit 2 isoform X2 [Pieris rapae]